MKIESLRKLTTKQLKERFCDACGEESLSSNHTHLLRRVAWQLQANASRGLEDRALKRAALLATEANPGLSLPQSFQQHSSVSAEPQDRDLRLPPVDQTVERFYRGKQF